MNEPLISIIIPVYNAEKYLKKCLDSVINQTYKNLEMILVDDGSTDNSGKICDDYASKNINFKVFHKKNTGIADTRNFGIKVTNSDYLFFLDSDDYITNDCIEFLIKALLENDCDIAVCPFYFFSDRAEKIGIKYLTKTINKAKYISKAIRDEIPCFLCDKIFKKEIFDNLKFEENVLYEDIKIFNHIFTNFKTDIAVINKPLYHYFLREASSCHNQNLKQANDYFEAIKSRYELSFISIEEKAYCLKNILATFIHICKFYDCKPEVINYYIKTINSLDKSFFVRERKLIPKKQFLKFKLVCYFPIIYKIFPKYYALKKAILKLFPQKRKSLLDNHSTVVI